jgi:ABC-2 type transport system permease protein
VNWQRIQTIIQKEWDETIRNRDIVLTALLLTLLFTAMPVVIGFVVPTFAGEQALNDPDLAPMLESMSALFPDFAGLSILQQFQILMVRQFLLLFLILPIMISLSIATFSIIGEKTSRSLEALLATPIRTGELLLAKSVAAAVPAVLVTWVGFAIFALVVRWMGGAQVFALALDGAAWATMLLITPLIALFGLAIGVIVSARASDPRSAQQVGGIIVLPLIAVIVAQLSGLFLLGLPLVLLGALVLLIVDVAILRAGVRLFNREAILTRWR